MDWPCVAWSKAVATKSGTILPNEEKDSKLIREYKMKVNKSKMLKAQFIYVNQLLKLWAYSLAPLSSDRTGCWAPHSID